jgi:hypothetical protein
MLKCKSVNARKVKVFVHNLILYDERLNVRPSFLF